MKIIVAPDSYKGTLSSIEVGKAIAQGIKEALPSARIAIIPLSDGGEGFVQSFLFSRKGQKIKCKTKDPLGRKIESFLGIIKNKKELTAVIEMASTSGLTLLKKGERNPEKTTTFGTGELIKKAISLGAKKVIIGIGGSATNDGGSGMARALGFRFLDKYGKDIPEGGASLIKLKRIVPPYNLNQLKKVEFICACDVDNPLLGPNGATHTYARQKGATPSQIKKLEKALKNFADIVEQDLGINIKKIKGGGAAGGLGAGLYAFLGAKLKPGFQVVSEVLSLEKRISCSNIAVTGEGCMDGQTRFGKAPYGLIKLARKNNIPVIAFPAVLGSGWQKLRKSGLTAVFPLFLNFNYERKIKKEELKVETKKRLSFIAKEVFLFVKKF